MSTTQSQSTDNIDQNLKMGLAFGKCPQHLLCGGVKALSDTIQLMYKTSSSSDLKEMEGEKEDISQCCCWQVKLFSFYFVVSSSV